jgi:hypothetical protein
VVFVIDMPETFSNTAGVPGTQTSGGGGALPTVTAGAAGTGPTITIPSTAPPSTLQIDTLIKGTGPVVEKGQYLVLHRWLGRRPDRPDRRQHPSVRDRHPRCRKPRLTRTWSGRRHRHQPRPGGSGTGRVMHSTE